MTEQSREVRNMQFLKIRADPSSHYARPDEVVSDERFEPAQKLDILRQWGRDLRRTSPDAADIGGSESDSRVQHIVRAVEALGGDPEEILKNLTD